MPEYSYFTDSSAQVAEDPRSLSNKQEYSCVPHMCSELPRPLHSADVVALLQRQPCPCPAGNPGAKGGTEDSNPTNPSQLLSTRQECQKPNAAMGRHAVQCLPLRFTFKVWADILKENLGLVTRTLSPSSNLRPTWSAVLEFCLYPLPPKAPMLRVQCAASQCRFTSFLLLGFFVCLIKSFARSDPLFMPSTLAIQ